MNDLELHPWTLFFDVVNNFLGNHQAKNYNKQTNICWFKYELKGFNDFTLRNIAIGQYHIYRKQKKKKKTFLNMRHFFTSKMATNQEKVRSFSDSVPSN